jgi:hypothetical protein
MAGAVRPRIPQIAGIFIAHRIDRKAVNPADVNQADLVFIRRAAVVTQLAVREFQRKGCGFINAPAPRSCTSARLTGASQTLPLPALLPPLSATLQEISVTRPAKSTRPDRSWSQNPTPGRPSASRLSEPAE